MARLLLIVALLAVVFWVYSVVDCAVQPPSRHRGVGKVSWMLIVLLLPVVGGLLWFAVGRVSRRAVSVYQAPDDDPEFLRSLAVIDDPDERIRRLEEELAQLDDEDEPTDPDAGPSPRRQRDGDDETR